MPLLKKILTLFLMFIVIIPSVVIGKWFYTTRFEAVDPRRGVFGMDGLEIWISVNSRLPTFARQWGCDTLLAREAAVFGTTTRGRVQPYSCQPGFETMVMQSTYDAVVGANLKQATAGLNETQASAVRTCFTERMAQAVTPSDIEALNKNAQGDALTKVLMAVNTTARDCTARAKQ